MQESLFQLAVLLACLTVIRNAFRLRRMEKNMDKLNASIQALTAAIAALQTRVTGSVPVAAVEAASVQIDAAVQTLNSIGV